MKKLDIVMQAKVVNIAVAACVTVSGIILLLMPTMGIEGEKILFGVVCLLLGSAKMVGYFSNDMYRLAFQFDFAIGIFAAVLGVLIFIGPNEIREALSGVIGAYIVLDGALKLQIGMDAKRFGITQWLIIFISAALTVLIGIFSLISTYVALSTELILGIALIVDGAENIWITAYTVRVRSKKKSISVSSDNE